MHKRSTPFSQTVPRELVHRAAISEVYLTSFTEVGDHEFELSAQWPRSHTFYRTHGGAVDSALLTETFRQATVLTAHLGYSVPLGLNFLLPDIRVIRFETNLGSGRRPAELTVSLKVHEVRSTPKGVVGLRVEGSFTCEGVVIGLVSAGARMIDHRSYTRFRNTHKRSSATTRCPEPIEPSQTGALHPSDVLLGQPIAENRWPLRVDTTHPVYFDHSLDHVPGMVLLEAARQAVRLDANDPSLDLSELEALFHSVVELDQQQTVSAAGWSTSPGGRNDSWTVTIESNGLVQMTARLTCVRPRGATTTPPRPSQRVSPRRLVAAEQSQAE